ncbi:MAG: alpha/beta fold hydrolase [Anaerolineae bacterium]|nr:alpha/beta fold hydrolase [Anaerolineae bacterium]
MNNILLTVGIILFIFLVTCLVLSVPLTKRHNLKDFRSPADLGLDFKPVHFPSMDGITLSGWWIPAEGSPNTIIFLHGFAGTMDPDLKYVPAFIQAGYNVLMFDFRAHGRSKRNRTSLGALEVNDVIGAIHFAKSCNSWAIGLMGFSMGGRAALLAAAQHPGIQAVISDGGPLRLSTAVSMDLRRRKVPDNLTPLLSFMILLGASLRLFTNLFYHDPLVLGGKIAPTPVLLIHGDRDPYTRNHELIKMVAKSKGNLSLWRVAGARHREVDLADPELYLQTVINFFDQHLKTK